MTHRHKYGKRITIRTVLRHAAVIVFCGCILQGSASWAGFEWTPPARQKAPDMPPPAAMPVTPVDIMDMTPIMPLPPSMDDSMGTGSSLMPVPQINEMPRQDMAMPAMHKQSHSTYDVIEGFGSDIPLALALQQIVPADYAYSFDPAVNPGLRVSWNGGKPWDQIIRDAVAPSNLNVTVSDKTVWLHHASVRSVAAAPSSAAISSPQPDDFMLSDSGMESKAVAPVHRRTAPATHSPQHLAALGSDSGHYNPSYPRRQPQATPLYIEDNAPPASGMPHSLGGDDQTRDQSFPAREPISSLSNMPEAPIVEPATTMTEPETMSYREPAMSAPEPMMPTMLAAAPTVSHYQDHRSWKAGSGDSLRLTLADWARTAGVELIWQADESDYIVESAVKTQGTFPDAVMDILTDYSDERSRPVGSLHPNLPDGRSVLLIESE